MKGFTSRISSFRLVERASRYFVGAVAVAALGCAPENTKELEEQQPVAETPSAPTTQSAALQGMNLSGINLAGANLGGNNLGGNNLGGANLGGNNLGGNNLGGNNLGGTNLGGNNLGGNNLAGTNLGGNNLGGNNLGGNNLGGNNLGGSNLGGNNLGGTNLGGNNLAGTNLGGNNLGGNNSGANIHSIPGAITGMLYSGEDQWMPKTGQCVVLGVGSTAFPKLLGQQSPNAKINVALGKLPWGFSATSGGAVALDAWEAVVWGDTTYCSFVLVAAPGTNWSGVAGFIKAVFRWNAPPTQSVDISGIEASAPYDPTVNLSTITYTGMMDAASRWKAGKINETNFIAGELAFVTATTNNQSVMVDFASWVMDSTKLGLVLANVENVNPPSRAEAVYYTLDMGSGNVSLGTWFADSWGPPTGMSDSNRDLDTAYLAWQRGTSQKPVPTRCNGSLYLNRNYAEPIPAGKCDDGLTWNAGGGPSMYRFWSGISGTTAPMNGYMLLPYNTSTMMKRPDANGVFRPVLSETYVHMWDVNYDLNRATGGTITATGTACASTQAAAKAFDNLMTPSNGTQWCVNSVPTTAAPASVMTTMATARKVNAYSITSAGDYQARDPRDWMLQGCNNTCTVTSDTGWVTLDTRTAQTFDARWQTNTYNLVNSTVYNRYRVRTTGNAGDTAKTQIGEIRLFDGGACTPQSDAALCSSLGKTCGSMTAIDNCGATRTVANCGACSAPLSCAGGGVANVCGSGYTSACNASYSQSSCYAYLQGSRVSRNGRNWTCSNGNCKNCAAYAACAPGGTGCQWGTVWQDNGPCN